MFDFLKSGGGDKTPISKKCVGGGIVPHILIGCDAPVPIFQ